jgi:hypothetical protein
MRRINSQDHLDWTAVEIVGMTSSLTKEGIANGWIEIFWRH